MLGILPIGIGSPPGGGGASEVALARSGATPRRRVRMPTPSEESATAGKLARRSPSIRTAWRRGREARERRDDGRVGKGNRRRGAARQRPCSIKLSRLPRRPPAGPFGPRPRANPELCDRMVEMGRDGGRRDRVQQAQRPLHMRVGLLEDTERRPDAPPGPRGPIRERSGRLLVGKRLRPLAKDECKTHREARSAIVDFGSRSFRLHVHHSLPDGAACSDAPSDPPYTKMPHQDDGQLRADRMARPRRGTMSMKDGRVTIVVREDRLDVRHEELPLSATGPTAHERLRVVRPGMDRARRLPLARKGTDAAGHAHGCAWEVSGHPEVGHAR